MSDPTAQKIVEAFDNFYYAKINTLADSELWTFCRSEEIKTFLLEKLEAYKQAILAEVGELDKKYSIAMTPNGELSDEKRREINMAWDTEELIKELCKVENRTKSRTREIVEKYVKDRTLGFGVSEWWNYGKRYHFMDFWLGKFMEEQPDCCEKCAKEQYKWRHHIKNFSI